MSYLHELCDALVNVLDHATALHVHRLAGYVANLNFWLEEVDHRLALLNGYAARYASSKQATKEYAKAHPESIQNSSLSHSAPSPPTSPSYSDQELWELRERVLASAGRFLVRCRRESLLEGDKVAEVCQRWQLRLQND